MTKRSPAFFLPEDPGASKDELRRRRVTRWHADATATATMMAARLEAEAGTLDMRGSGTAGSQWVPFCCHYSWLDVIGHSMALIHLPPYAAAAAASASQHASARRSSPPAGRPPPPPPPPPSMTSEDVGPSDRAGGGDGHRAPAGHKHLSDTLLPLQPSSPGSVADLPELHLPSAGSSSSAGVRNSSGTPSMLVTLLELSEVNYLPGVRYQDPLLRCSRMLNPKQKKRLAKLSDGDAISTARRRSLSKAAEAEAEAAACATRAETALVASRMPDPPAARFSFADVFPRTIGPNSSRTRLEALGGRCDVSMGVSMGLDTAAAEAYEDVYPDSMSIFEGSPTDWYHEQIPTFDCLSIGPSADSALAGHLDSTLFKGSTCCLELGRLLKGKRPKLFVHDAGPCVQNHAHSSTGSVDESGGGGTQLAEERAGACAGACAGAEEVLHDIARPFTAIAERLEQCGYAVDWKIIGSSKNVYIVGVRGDLDVECVRDYNPDEAAHCSFPPSC
eukprot:gene9373-21567_t